MTSSITPDIPRPSLRFAPVGSDDHVVGPADAPVTLVMYGNYECLHCRRAYPAVSAVRAELGTRLRLVHRHFARAADFPRAELAAEAAEAAARQGKFRDMHEALSLHARFLDESALLAEADRVRLDVARVAADLDGRRYQTIVRAHTARALATGVTATPTFFVNGEHVGDAWDLDGLRTRLVDLARALG